MQSPIGVKRVNCLKYPFLLNRSISIILIYIETKKEAISNNERNRQCEKRQEN